MALITLSDAHLAYGDLPLLDEAALSIEPGERVGLIGRNGTGKSSLLSVLAGKQLLEDGHSEKALLPAAISKALRMKKRSGGFTQSLTKIFPALNSIPMAIRSLLRAAKESAQHLPSPSRLHRS